MKKDIEFLIKKLFFSERYLLKKRLRRAIKKEYEKELKIVDKFANKSKDALDIGVYRGVYSYKMSESFKNIHSFEPNPLLFPYLNKNLKKIVKNIKLYNYALSDVNGETELRLPLRSNSIFKDNIEELFQLGAATMHPNNDISKFKKVAINTRRLDDIQIDNNVGFIKIDVEGHEKNVIVGGKSLIMKDKPVMLIEIEERHTKKPIKETINFIKEMNYECFYLNKDELIKIENNYNKVVGNNFIFLPK